MDNDEYVLYLMNITLWIHLKSTIQLLTSNMQTNTCLLINETDVTPAEVRVDDDEIMEIFTA